MSGPLEGELVRLRAREPGDEPLLYDWFNDAEVLRHLSLRYPVSHAAERDFIEAAQRVGYESAVFAIDTLAEGIHIGGCSLAVPVPEDRCGTLGIAIGDTSRWDGGYGTDTTRVLCRFGFEMINLHRIELTVDAGNARARRVYERVGFRTEGTLREAIYRRGAYVDVIRMGLLEGELAD